MVVFDTKIVGFVESLKFTYLKNFYIYGMQLRIYVLPGNLWLYVKLCLCLVLFNTVTYTQCNICSTCFVEITIQLDMFIYVYIATFFSLV